MGSTAVREGNQAMKFTVIGRHTGCKWCVKAEALLKNAGLDYEYLEVNPTLAALLEAMGLTTVPQVWRGTEHIGGYEELLKWSSQN